MPQPMQNNTNMPAQGQAQQQKPTQTQKPVFNVAPQTQPNQQMPQTPQGTGQQIPVSKPKSVFKLWWFWVVMALIIIGAGVGAYFVFFK